MTFATLRNALPSAYRDVLKHHTFQVAAALSYYFVLAVFPALIFLSAVVGFIPLPDLFGHVLVSMGRVLPTDSMRMVYSVLADVLATNRGAWLSFGILGTLWVVSTAFDATIEALDIVYEVKDDRPFWKSRLQALALAAISGGLLLVALAVLIVGPRFAAWLASRMALSGLFVFLWPAIHWIIVICFTIVAVEVIYFLAPNVKQRFLATLPGALVAVTSWIGLSYLLGIYFRHFANFSKTYGTLGGFIAFMVWLYWTSFFLLVGGELNAELAKASRRGQLRGKDAGSLEGLDGAA